jgi:photosystem II stability/assembly factor-like uncharacterized protein
MGILQSLTTTDWLPFGPAPIDAPNVGLGLADGRIEAAAPDPSNADVMYVGANDGGVWKTGVWGSDPPVWLALTDGQPSLNFAGYHPLAVHPANPALVFGAVCGVGAGVLRSANHGLSWQLLGNGLFEGASIGSLAVHPTNPNVLWVSVWWNGPGGGVYKSTNGGQNWVVSSSGVGGACTDVVRARWDANTLFAGVVGGASPGLRKSTDGGMSWSLLTGIPAAGFSLAKADKCAIRIESGLATGVVYVAYLSLDAGGNVAIHRVRTKNGGASWVALNPTPPPDKFEDRPWHLLLGVDPGTDAHVFANAKYAIYESKDSGNSWVRADIVQQKKIGDDWVNIAFAKRGVVLTADRDLYSYNPTTKAWKSKEGNQQVTLFYDVTPDPTNPDVVYGVAQDHTCAMKFDTTVEWAYMNGGGGEVGKVLVDPTSTSRIYVSNPLDPGAFVARSTTGGQAWTVIFVANDFQPADYPFAYAVQRSFAIDPSKPKRLVIGTTRVWQTANAAVANPSWSAISGVLGGATADQQYITALAIAPSDSNTIYVATADGHVWATTNGGTSWKKRDSGLFGMGAGAIVDIRTHPQNANRAVAVGNGKSSVWFLNKVGTNLKWTNISGNLPTNLRFGAIFADWQFSTPALYLATTRRVYHSVDLGTTWTVFGSGMPHTVVSDLQSVVDNVLVAATNGRGAWAILIGPVHVAGVVRQALAPGQVGPGDPVEGVVISLDPGNGVRRHDLTAVSDAQGRFGLPSVAPGEYIVRRTAPPGWIAVGGTTDPIALHGPRVELDYQYRFDRSIARVEAPVPSVAGVVARPGRAPTAPIGAPDEFDQRQPAKPKRRTKQR